MSPAKHKPELTASTDEVLGIMGALTETNRGVIQMIPGAVPIDLS